MNEVKDNEQITQEVNTSTEEEETKNTETKDLDTKNTVDIQKEVEKAKKESRTETLRELSKTLGHNLFSDDDIKSFKASLDNKIDKSEYEKAQEKLSKLETIAVENENLKIDNVLLRESVDPKHQGKVKKLLKIEMDSKEGLTIEDAIKTIVNDFPVFVAKTQKAGMYMGDEHQTKTGYEKEMEKYENNPYYKNKK